VDNLNADVSFDAIAFSASGPYDSYSGRHVGRVVGTLRKITHAPAPIDVWVTYPSPVTGATVSINDTHQHTVPGDTYTDTLMGSGPPYTGTTAPSQITLNVSYATCTYDLIAGYSVEGSYTHDGAITNQPLGVGRVVILQQPLDPHSAGSTLQGDREIPLVTDDQHTGYTPGQVHSDWTVAGQTTAHWSITAMP
jgi:hypothetical protein